MVFRWFMLMVFIATAPWCVRAEIMIEPGVTSINLSSQVEVLRDAPKELDIEEVVKPEWGYRFVKPIVRGSALNLGMATEVLWLRLSLDIKPGSEREWVLDIPYGSFKKIQWYVRQSKNDAFELASELKAPVEDYRYDAQPVSLRPGSAELYARIESEGALTLPLQLQTESDFYKQEGAHLFMQALYFGALLALLVYAILFGWSVKDKTYMIFSGYLLSSTFAIFTGNGLARLYVWSPQDFSEQVIQSASYALAGAFSLMLTRAFLNSIEMTAWLAASLKLFYRVYWMVAFGMLARLLFMFDTAILDVVLSLLTLVSAVTVIVALWMARAGGQSELYFMGAWFIVWLGAMVAALRVLNWIPSNELTLYAMQMTTGISALLFSIALFVRVRQQYEARMLAQQQALQARFNLIETLRDSERKLEATVMERTMQLQSSLEAEKRLREQYVRFGAMISHEFRNPLGVIETQTSLLQRELKAGIDNTGKRIGTVRSAAQRLALLFEKWLQSDRLQNATDKLQLQPIDMDSWLEDLVSKCHAYHANHHITCEIEGRIGTVFADERLLQIAVLNLIDNACKYSSANTTVWVTAKRMDESLCIEVTDQGRGIEEHLLDKVFDEYFRVDPNSPVIGVGLGLPFVRKILTLHGGLALASKNPHGQGARFTLKLPCRS